MTPPPATVAAVAMATEAPNVPIALLEATRPSMRLSKVVLDTAVRIAERLKFVAETQTDTDMIVIVTVYAPGC